MKKQKDMESDPYEDMYSATSLDLSKLQHYTQQRIYEMLRAPIMLTFSSIFVIISAIQLNWLMLIVALFLFGIVLCLEVVYGHIRDFKSHYMYPLQVWLSIDTWKKIKPSKHKPLTYAALYEEEDQRNINRGQSVLREALSSDIDDAVISKLYNHYKDKVIVSKSPRQPDYLIASILSQAIRSTVSDNPIGTETLNNKRRYDNYCDKIIEKYNYLITRVPVHKHPIVSNEEMKLINQQLDEEIMQNFNAKNDEENFLS